MSHSETASEITCSFKTEAISLSASGELTVNIHEATPAETLKHTLDNDQYESDSSVESDKSVQFISHTLASEVRNFYNLTNLDASYEIVLENTTRTNNNASINCSDFFQIPLSFESSIHSEKQFLTEEMTMDDQVMKVLFNVHLTRSFLRCLLTQSKERKAKWLNDEVINAYFNILQRNCNDDKVAFATTHFMAKLLVDGDKYEYDATLKRFFSEASKQLSLNIFELNEIFVPINIHNVHWTLIFIDMLNHEIQYYDPMPGNDEDNNIFLQATLQWLVDEAKITSTAFDTSKWRLMEMKNGPKQSNGYDCGMYLIMTANCLTEKIPLSLLTSENITYLRDYVWFKIMSYRSRGAKKENF
jgi:sentrin-specific protease 1